MSKKYSWTTFLFISLTILPATYCLAMIQYSGLVYPFWDHLELVKIFREYAEGTLSWSHFVASHNHSRPLTYRLIYFLNGIATDWNIRSEYIYMQATVGAGALFLVGILKNSVRHEVFSSKKVFWISCAVLSFIYFSPGGHNNHWWSMMLQLNLANTLILAGLYFISRPGESWSRHILSAVCMWLSVYTLTNALVFFLLLPAAYIVVGSGIKKNRPQLIFWILNCLIIFPIYMNGLSETGGGKTTPLLLDLAKFAIIYLGTSLGNLISFSFQSQFDLPTSRSVTIINGMVGLLAIVAALWFVFLRIKQKRWQEYFLPMVMIGFSLMSALLTAYARAHFDSYGIYNANASRYTVFSSYWIYAFVIIFLNDGLQTFQSAKSLRWLKGFLALFFLLSLVSYSKSKKVYKSAREFNQVLKRVYNFEAVDTTDDLSAYPNLDVVRDFRKTMKNLKIGPYAKENF